jgi:hypothetical protein
MADYKEYDWNPYNLPRELHEAIGLVNTCFAQSEQMLQDAIAGCAGLDFEYGKAITTHMAMPLRFSVFHSVAEIRIDDLDALDELDALIAQFESAAQKRNAVAHNWWCRDPETGDLFTLKETARSRFETDLLPMTINQVKGDALFIYEVGMSLFAFLKRHGLVPPISSRPSRDHKSKAARKKRRESKL